MSTRRWRRFDGFLLALVSLSVYTLLGQKTAYGDGCFLLTCYELRVDHLPVHTLYLPMLRGAAAVLAPLGLTPYGDGLALSALGTAVGIGFVHAACSRLGMPRLHAALATLALVATPAVLFFATVVELHGPFFAFAGATMWCVARLVVAPSVLAAVWAGCASGLSFHSHATGALLGGLAVAVFWGTVDLARCGWRRAAALGSVLVAVHGTWIYGGSVLLRVLGFGAGTGRTVGWGEGLLRRMDSTWSIWGTVWYEWLVAFMPLSLVWLVGFRHRAGRRLALWLVPCIVAYLVVAFRLVGDFHEHGAYLLPLAFPLVLVTVRGLPARAVSGVLTACVAIGLGVSMCQVDARDDGHASAAMADEFRREVAGGRSELLTGGDRDAEVLLVRLPEVEFCPVAVFCGALTSQQLPALVRSIRQRLRDGVVFFVTHDAVDYMRHPERVPWNKSGPLVLRTLEREFRWREVGGESWLGHRLELR